VDVVYRASGGRLRWDFEVSPRTTPGAIMLSFPGAPGALQVDGEGRLVLPTDGGDVVQSAPVAYQVLDDGTKVAVRSQWVPYRPNPAGFAVSGYDSTRALIIDPYIYNTFLGGNGNDQGNGV